MCATHRQNSWPPHVRIMGKVDWPPRGRRRGGGGAAECVSDGGGTRYWLCLCLRAPYCRTVPAEPRRYRTDPPAQAPSSPSPYSHTPSLTHLRTLNNANLLSSIKK
ncbi:hypothetical protein LSTR_LSTR000812 [Laodelphax striatellus]|uniref:Uncharacterized protein n=1 Tax=Laodelphax striatellus TaxID=195883 RepID=A0A482XH39_LAOST|nr:hypothetical protein LSTR_LSTR000812 [Laodelphax striatellus]